MKKATQVSFHLEGQFFSHVLPVFCLRQFFVGPFLRSALFLYCKLPGVMYGICVGPVVFIALYNNHFDVGKYQHLTRIFYCTFTVYLMTKSIPAIYLVLRKVCLHLPKVIEHIHKHFVQIFRFVFMRPSCPCIPSLNRLFIYNGIKNLTPTSSDYISCIIHSAQ